MSVMKLQCLIAPCLCNNGDCWVDISINGVVEDGVSSWALTKLHAEILYTTNHTNTWEIDILTGEKVG